MCAILDETLTYYPYCHIYIMHVSFTHDSVLIEIGNHTDIDVLIFTEYIFTGNFGYINHL